MTDSIIQCHLPTFMLLCSRLEWLMLEFYTSLSYAHCGRHFRCAAMSILICLPVHGMVMFLWSPLPWNLVMSSDNVLWVDGVCSFWFKTVCAGARSPKTLYPFWGNKGNFIFVSLIKKWQSLQQPESLKDSGVEAPTGFVYVPFCDMIRRIRRIRSWPFWWK